MKRMLTGVGAILLAAAVQVQAQESRSAYGERSLPASLAAEISAPAEEFQDVPPLAPAGGGEKKWRIDAALYVWAASLQGDLSVGPLSVKVDEEFSETLENLDGAAALHEEIWNRNRVGILIDLCWLRLKDEPKIGPIQTTSTVAMGINELAGALRFTEGEVFMDLIAGVRWVFLRTSIETASGGPSDTRERSFIDPMFGARLGVDATDWLRLTMRVDVGGFGVGSEMSGQLALMAGIRITDHVGLIVGYRALGMNVEANAMTMDVRMHGPVFAVDVGF